MSMRGESGKPGLFPDPAEVVSEKQPDRSDSHGCTVAIRSTGEMLFGDLAVIAAVLHRFKNKPSAATIAAGRHVIGDKGLAQVFLDDFPSGNQSFRYPNRHLGIIGVPDLLLRIIHQGFIGREAGADRLRAMCLEFSPKSIAYREAEKTAEEPILQNGGRNRHVKTPHRP